MIIKVKVFASLREKYLKTKLGEIIPVELENPSTGRELLKKLNIPEEEVKLFIVNGRWRDIDKDISDGDRVGIFPPVGGG